MDIKMLKYMKKLAMKYAKYNFKSEKFFDAYYKALDNDEDEKAEKYRVKADKYKNKAYYIKEVYDLEVKILGSIHGFESRWEEL